MTPSSSTRSRVRERSPSALESPWTLELTGLLEQAARDAKSTETTAILLVLFKNLHSSLQADSSVEAQYLEKVVTVLDSHEGLICPALRPACLRLVAYLLLNSYSASHQDRAMILLLVKYPFSFHCLAMMLIEMFEFESGLG